jgi:D-glycero-D-manno-heptose 1,7-bisphosphate phosphatase
MKKPALFLDRDDLINVNYGYVHQKKNFVFVDGIFDLVHEANKLRYLVVVNWYFV